MKKVFGLLITLTMLVSAVVVPMTVSADASVWDGTTVDTEWAGDGTEASPYLITSAAELAGLASKTFNAISASTDVPVAVSETENVYNSYTGKHFKLTADIDLGGNEWLPIGRAGMRFNGNFDGNKHIVKNFKMEKNYIGMGLFGTTGSAVVIKNLGIENVNFIYDSRGLNSGTYEYNADLERNEDFDKTWNTTVRSLNRTYGTGALIGVFAGGTVSDCYVRGVRIKNTNDNARQQNMGGLLGGPMSTLQHTGNDTDKINITNCYVNDGYPVLGWEKTWTVETDPQSFYKVTDYADGKVTLIQSDNTVGGVVVVAVYDGTRFANAATAAAANGEITVDGITAEDGNTIKVFVWNSMTGLTPLCDVYSPAV